MTPEIEQARTAAQSASQAYGQTAAEEPTISDVLKQKVIEAYNSSQDIVKPLDVATQTYLGAPQAGREKYQDIFNPFQRENLVSKYVGTEALPMLSLSSILGQRFGRYDDLIGAGTNAFRAQVLAQQAKAEQARQLYSDLLGEYTTGEQLKSQSLADQLAREKFEWDKRQDGNGNGRILRTDGVRTGTSDWEIETEEDDLSNTITQELLRRLLEEQPQENTQPKQTYQWPTIQQYLPKR